jgi:PTS system nitrogen regulatory IIA component
MPGEFMTLEEAAKYLNMSTGAVNLLIEKGFARKAEDGKVLVKSEEIMEWVNRGIKDLDANQLNKLEKDYGEHATLIYPLLEPNCITRNIIGTSKVAVITELVDLLIEKGGVEKKHRATILKAIIERERMCSTAVIEGIAFPHPREPLRGIIKKPRLVMGLSWTGIDFESFDGTLTHVVMLLCAPKLDVHLKLLARLSKLLRNPKMRVALCRAKSNEDVVETFSSFEKDLR